MSGTNKDTSSRSGNPAVRTVSITGTGSYAPERVLTNADLEKMVDTTEEWIVSRTGMQKRHIAADGETTSDMGAEAAKKAIEDAGLTAADVDLIVAPTITPDMPWPNTGCLIQHKLGAVNAFCMGLEAACSGFVYGIETARNYVATGAVETALVVAAEKMSSILDWEDRGTCVLFGDGAGAAVLQANDKGCGIMGTVMGSDGSLSNLLMVPAGGSRMPTSEKTIKERLHYLKMNGRETYRHAVTEMTEAAQAVLSRCGMTVDDVDWLIPHQANMRIIQAVAQRLGVPLERFVINIEEYGNTSGATIGLALDEAVKDGRIKQHDNVLLVAFGGGFTWGALVMEWCK